MIGIIFNPVSGKGLNRHRMENLRRILDGKGFEYAYRETECYLDAVRLSREMASECDILVAAGGDGTLHEVLNGALPEGVTRFGVLPFGSGNDVARSMGVFDKTDEELADMIMNQKLKEVDTGLAGERPFIQFLTFGIVSNIIKAYSEVEAAGEHGYRKALMRTILKQKARHYIIEVPGMEPIDCMSDFVSVQNVEYAGAGLPIHPAADPCDGRMDLIIVVRKSKLRFLLNVMALVKGELTSQPNTVVIPVTSCRIIPDGIETGVVDGELADMGGTDMRMRRSVEFMVC